MSTHPLPHIDPLSVWNDRGTVRVEQTGHHFTGPADAAQVAAAALAALDCYERTPAHLDHHPDDGAVSLVTTSPAAPSAPADLHDVAAALYLEFGAGPATGSWHDVVRHLDHHRATRTRDGHRSTHPA